ncbi:MAG: hypothetical protein ABI266_03685 [Ginsengibacter sp.]
MIEKLFDITNFEQSLKEHADDFTIVPSRNVWQGIYNNIHPGRKWPSIPMALMLLLSLMGIGYLNNAPVRPAQNEINLNKNNLTSTPKSNAKSNGKSHLSVASINNEITRGINDKENTNEVALKKVSIKNEVAEETDQTILDKNQEGKQLTSVEEIPVTIINSYSQSSSKDIPEIETLTGKEIAGIDLNKNVENNISPNNKLETDDDNQKKANSNISKSLIKKQPKITLSYFIMPTVTNVYFAGNEEKDIKSTGSLIAINPDLSQGNMIINAQLGLKLGGQVEYHFNSKWQLLLIGQASYSGYTIISNKEPLALGKLALKDKSGPVYSKAYVTNLGNGKSDNQVPLTNYSIQISLPIGMQYEIWKNKSTAIFLSAAAGPSFVLRSNAHILSSDGRNYVDDQSLMRKNNYTGFVGTHIEFSAKNLKWRIGPTVGYQLLSTYEDKYPVKEHLIDYGIKIGISK